MSIRTVISKALESAYIKGLIATLFAVGLVGVGAIGSRAAGAICGQADPANDVVYCGAGSISNLVNDYDHGVPGHDTAKSIQDIYGWSGFGITSDDIHSMVTGANGEKVVMGFVTRDTNEVVVNGKVVATDALSAGRGDIPGSTQRDNNGTIFYTNTPKQSFLNPTLSAYVVMKNGVFQFAIISSCDNPVSGHHTPPPPPPPTPKCNCVKVSVDQTSSTNFIFHATGSVSGGAVLTGFMYTILDSNGNTITTHQAGADGVWNYTQTTPGDYTVEAVAQAKTPDGKTITSSLSPDCKKPFKVPTPQAQFASCVELSATAPDSSGNVDFTATESHSAGEKVTKLMVDFGDGSTPFTTTTTTPVPNTPDTFQATTSHTYTQSATATLTVDYLNTIDNTTSTSDNCTATITIPSTPPPTCTPGQIQVNGQCETPSCENGGLTGAVCQSTPPAPLPSTGASDEIPAATVGLSSTVTAAGYYIRSRRKYASRGKIVAFIDRLKR
ncbi:MAG TPA: LPXTG cell wall anchor domain-containing protein [Candidatus Saccharimonadales bacterium]|nr:LPXTG cell wall anchor domain-containing protein [Candidatus Saccharimonadales bacterium]